MDIINKKSMAVKVLKDTELSGVSTIFEAKTYVDAYVALLIDLMLEHKQVRFAGVGSLVPRFTIAREGRNPKTGEPHPIPRAWTYSLKKHTNSDIITMYKTDQITLLRFRCSGMSIKTATYIVSMFSDYLTVDKTTISSPDVMLRGLGSFVPKWRETRVVRNPSNNLQTISQGGWLMTFKLSAALRKKLNPLKLVK